MSKQSNFIAHVEDAEEDSGSSVEGIEGTRKYAISEAPVSPIKERPNTGKSRSEKRPSHRRSESSSASLSLTDSSDSTAHPAKKEREVRRPSQKDVSREQRLREKEKREQKLRAAEEEERRRAKAEAKAMKEIKAKKTRPTSSLKHAATQPVVQQSSIYKRGHVGHPEDPSCYGVAQPAASGSRPRAQTRPASYYAGQTSRPPIANAGWHQSHQPPPQPYPHHHVVGTFPPPLHMLPPSPASQMGLSPSPLTMPGYFDAAMTGHHANLKQRFETRPSSAMGFRSPAIRGYAPEEFESDAGSTRVSRRPSRSKKHEDDRKKMPPPPSIPKRPQSAFPQSTPFAPPPAPQAQRPSSRRGQSRPAPPHRRSVGFVDQPGYEDEDFQGDVGLFQDMSPGAPSPYEPRRTPSGRLRVHSNAYEQQALDIMPANGRGRAVAPYAGGGAPVGSFGTSYENDAYFSALRYQEDVSGPQVPLTADSLRKITKRGGVPSSRSTRSSGSRDDSEYKRSNTTGTGITRSSSGNNEDVIIKFSGTSVVRLQGAEIECSDGEIMFSRPGGGSDRASTIFQIEDARGRPERKALPLRARAPSQSDSQSRGYAPSYAPSYPPSHAPYDPALSPDNYF